jgi:hypothetical protein
VRQSRPRKRKTSRLMSMPRLESKLNGAVGRLPQTWQGSPCPSDVTVGVGAAAEVRSPLTWAWKARTASSAALVDAVAGAAESPGRTSLHDTQ